MSKKGGSQRIVGQADNLSELSCYRFFSFSSLYKYFKDWEDVSKEIPMTSVARKYLQDFESSFITKDRAREEWYTDKFGKFSDYITYAKNTEFLHWQEYNDMVEAIRPMIDELKRESLASIIEPKFIYNEKGLGVFDFAKASTVLLPQYVYYSVKLKKIVSKDDVKIVEDGSGYSYMLIKDKSKVILLPSFHDSDNLDKAYAEIIDKLKSSTMDELNGNGFISEIVSKYNLTRKVYSTVKKSYLYKEKLPMPKRAIRIFCYVGGNASINPSSLIYSGISAIAVAQLLEQIGYSVSIIAIFGRRDTLRFPKGSTCQELSNNQRVTVTAVELKKFTESLDIESLLVTMAESTFFRGTIFYNWLWEISKYNDPSDGALGYPLSRDEIKDSAFFSVGKRDGYYVKNKNGKYSPNEQSPLLYYLISGVYSFQEAIEQIRTLVLSVDEENMRMREKLYSSLEI
jgi:hypothetical protein